MIPIKYNYVELDLQYMKLFSIIVMTRSLKDSTLFLLKFRNYISEFYLFLVFVLFLLCKLFIVKHINKKPMHNT